MKRMSERRARKYDRGFSLVAAIFVLVILAALGAFMITIGEIERWTTVGAAQGARAYDAAAAGLEWGVSQAVNADSCVSNPTFSPPTFTLNAGGLSGFNVGVDCTRTAVTEGGTPYFTYAIVSKATFGTFGSPDYFSRTLQITVTSPAAP